ncbi:hypothetical protein BD770DRAFT_472400 [Pilaira anomala]|nr:hypothetical protein BD770DRAFT_472400 [Pilaira anomala]
MMTDDTIVPLATPTRFLIESGEWNLTPNIGGSIQNEMNPFDCNFQSRASPIMKNIPTVTTSTDKWTPPSPNTFNHNTITYASPEPDVPALSSPSTPPMTHSQSPASSSSFFSLSTETSPPLQSINSSSTISTNPAPQTPPQVDEYNHHRRSSRIQTKQNIFSEYLEEEGEEEEMMPRTTTTTSTTHTTKTASVQSGRKRRIVFEGDDAEDRRKKFLERNRVAAYKCRQKKKNWMQELEQKAELQNNRNDELRALVSQLKEESMYLRNLLLTHGNCDCDSVQAYLRKTSAEITSNPTAAATAAAAAAATTTTLSHAPPPTLPPSSRRQSVTSNPSFHSMPSYQSTFSTIPPFQGTSTGLTPFLNTVINKPEPPSDYFSHTHSTET